MDDFQFVQMKHLLDVNISFQSEIISFDRRQSLIFQNFLFAHLGCGFGHRLFHVKVRRQKLFRATAGKNEAAFIQDLGSEYAAESFRSQIEKSKFLWVKNIWVTDSPSAHPVESSWDKFKSSYGYDNKDEAAGAMNDEKYALLIADLAEEQAERNGYFILAIITAGVTFLMQFVTAKSQKASMELQTVNGQGAQTQKIMMWMMPIMMAFFAFLYTAAFSIYLILSQTLSILFTLLINWIIGKKFKAQIENRTPQKIRGRVYVPEVKEEEKVKKNPDENEHDFIKGGKTSHVRGRLK